MKMPLNSCMRMENKESCRVRRKLHQLEWLQLCRKSMVAEKGVCYLQCIFLVKEVRMLRMRR